ncbi:hypothetical protein [Nonomuraea indica]|uniref:hypothetical protein n=1 Tax=Nonomuraea indica TaxID=1581193 RepID=UPI000C7CECD0|nr:hypothetical protein [Nonomuraea indica]
MTVEPPQPPPTEVLLDWNARTGVSRTTLTTHVWTAPPLRRDSPIHDKAFGALRDLNADLARFLPWYSHPRLAVPALTPPTTSETSWDFALLDPFVEDFMNAAQGRPVVADFATIPSWMFVTPEPVPVAEDPGEIHWEYEQGTELRDPTLNEVVDYFYRIASWYIAGGFTDELGRRHESGHHYRFAYWEVLCEPDMGHRIPPESYTRLYGAVVERLRPLDPEMKFIGLSLSPVAREPEYFWHFLDPANHADGVAPDAISYHFYAFPEIVNPVSEHGNAPYEHWRGLFFAQAEAFLDQVRHIDAIRRRLAPATRTFINEVGTYPPDLMNPAPTIPEEYWSLSAALQSYLWARLVELGVDLVGIAEFMDYPGMIPGATLIDWDTGAPNARYRALQLLLRHFAAGDSLVTTSSSVFGYPDNRIHAQGFVTVGGDRKLLLVNKTDEPVGVAITAQDGRPGQVEQTGVGSGAAAPVRTPVRPGEPVVIDAFATAVVSF